ncbi:MAG TPA: VWA domain-containing protein [Candidatus Dormibacteraeota bacterium]|nr:VWA domain-containing protein [Candidatus Dormibacteraeota bacterium]
MKQLLFCLALTTAMCAQVSVPAIVIDNSGHAVHSLQKSDFSVRCDKAATFDSVEEVAPVSLNGFSDPTPVFILYDAVSVPAPTEGQVSNMLLEYLRRATAERLPVTLLVNQGGGVVKIIHDLSTDPSILGAAIPRIASKDPQPNSDSADPNFDQKVKQETERLNELTHFTTHRRFGPLELQQLAALQAIGTMLQRSSKRKLLVWITASFAVTMGSDEILHPKSGAFVGNYQSELVATYQGTMEVLNKARVSVYPIQILPPSGAWYGLDGVMGFDGIAKSTGGRVLDRYRDANDFAASMADLRKHVDSYYALSFSTQPQKRSWVSTTIKVSRPDTKVFAPNGFIAGQ